MPEGLPVRVALFGSLLVPLGIALSVAGVGGYLPGNLVIVGGLAVTVGIGSYVLLEQRPPDE